ncbi:MAG: orotidine-5'-phosphate decarboxylase [Chloroflexi bacterium]|nr:orotidine-5'-phosphate decarboxylase [Chloroflexota bacterium]
MFAEKLRAATESNNSYLCVGLDPDPERMPHQDVVPFLRDIIEATKDIVCAYKANFAFFEALGIEGMQTLLESITYVPANIPVIADAKRGDIGNTARFYADAIFNEYGFDAVTVNGYGGRDAVQPFLDYDDRGVFVWCRSSNVGAEDFQDLELSDGRPLYLALAEKVGTWNEHGNAGLVLGATWPEQIERVREVCPDILLLLPGVGAQEGDLEATVEAAMSDSGGGFIVNASRGVLYAGRGDHYAKAARNEALKIRGRINVMREAALAGGNGRRSSGQ